MAPQGKLIRLLPRDAVFARQIFCGQAHRKVSVRSMFYQIRVGREFVAAHGYQAHAFRPACDDDVRETRDDPFGCKCNRLQSGRAEAIDGKSRCAHGKSGSEHGNPRDVHPLLRLGDGAAQNHVFDIGAVQARHAADCFADGCRGHVVGTRVAQRPSGRLPYGCSCRACDYCFSHKSSVRTQEFKNPRIQGMENSRRSCPSTWILAFPSLSRFRNVRILEFLDS